MKLYYVVDSNHDFLALAAVLIDRDRSPVYERMAVQLVELHGLSAVLCGPTALPNT